MDYLQDLFGLDGRVAVVTGGTGTLGGALARGLARAGAKVGVLGRRANRALDVVREIEADGGTALALVADVLDAAQLEGARDTILAQWGHIDILVNAAGGSTPRGVPADSQSFFDLPRADFQDIFDLNVLGTVLPCQTFGAVMIRSGQSVPSGSIVNISSVTSRQGVTRVGGYSAAKAAIDTFTRWLAIELTRQHGPGLRVNAVAPGWFLAEGNRGLLLDEDGSLTPRAQKVIAHTPAQRFGRPDELISTVIWLCGPGATYVNGVVVPVDGGFSAFSGV